MLRSELVDKIHKDNPYLTREESERVVAVILESVIQTLEKGARVELRGFARKGRNPRTGETVMVPEKHVPFFRAGKELKARVDNQG